MTHYNIETDNLPLDFESFSATGIELEPEQINRALELSDRLINPERQWRTYLNSLALFGFETWLQERDSSLSISSENCSVKLPHYANFIDGVFNLTVGDYKLCLLTNGVTVDEFIAIERAVIELPEYIPHLYIAVNVIEEQGEVQIAGFIRYDEIIQRQERAKRRADSDWKYEIPLAWFNSETDDILLHLRCLNVDEIALPSHTAPSIGNLQEQLEPFLPQLQSGEIPLSEILTWSQATPLLSSSNLLTWLYQLQTTQPSLGDALTTLKSSLGDRVGRVTQRAINVRAWLSNELDTIAQNLAWTLLPVPVMASNGLRNLAVINRNSPGEEFAAIMMQLRNNGEDIPPEARGACQDFFVGNHGLRLFAVTWEIAETEGVPEWCLLLVLGAQMDNYLPQGLKLEVKEGETVLDEKIVTEDTDDSYLYTQIIGELDEEFTVNIILANGETSTFPTFVFN